MTNRSILLSLACVWVAAACTDARAPSNDAPAAAERALRERDLALQNAIAARNLEHVVSFYADDAVLMPAAAPAIDDKAAIREEWDHVLAIPDFENESSLTRVEISDGGDLAYTSGTYVAKMRGEDGVQIREPGKWLTVWKRERDGEWRIVMDIYNTDVPPPDHK